MPVFNVAANQVLATPVSSYYQGKAIRLANKNAELVNQRAQEALDNNLDERKMQVDEGNLQMRVTEYAREVGEEQAKSEARQILAIAAGAEEVIAGGGSQEEALAYSNAEMMKFIETLPEGEQKAALQKMAEDDFQPEELAGMTRGAQLLLGESGKEGSFIVFRNPENGEKQTVRTDSPEASALGNAGWERVGLTSKQLQTDDPNALYEDPRTGSQKGAAHQANLDEYNASSDVHELISSALPRAQASPDSVGFKGKFAVGAAGLLSTLGYDELADGVAKAVAGNDVEAITAMQTQLQALRGRIIPLVTGEQGKRLSETEREIASRAVGLIDSITGPADLTKAYPQVIGAMKQLYEEGWATKYRIAERDKYIDYPYDLNSREEMLEFVNESIQAGLDDESIQRMVTRLRLIQGIKIE